MKYFTCTVVYYCNSRTTLYIHNTFYIIHLHKTFTYYIQLHYKLHIQNIFSTFSGAVCNDQLTAKDFKSHQRASYIIASCIIAMTLADIMYAGFNTARPKLHVF